MEDASVRFAAARDAREHAAPSPLSRRTTQTANTQTEEAANTDEVDVPKVEERPGGFPKADGKTDATKTDEKSGDTVKDESKDAPKGEPGDEAKDAPIGDTENPPWARLRTRMHRSRPSRQRPR